MPDPGVAEEPVRSLIAHPNPTKEQMTLQGTYQQVLAFDALGRTVDLPVIRTQVDATLVDLSFLASGIYPVRRGPGRQPLRGTGGGPTLTGEPRCVHFRVQRSALPSSVIGQMTRAHQGASSTPREPRPFNTASCGDVRPRIGRRSFDAG